MEDQGNEEEISEDDCNAHSSADSLSVMFPPCQDPLLVNLYRGLPALPCVASILFCKVCELKTLFFQVAFVRWNRSQALWILFALRLRIPVKTCPSQRLGMFLLTFDNLFVGSFICWYAACSLQILLEGPHVLPQQPVRQYCSDWPGPSLRRKFTPSHQGQEEPGYLCNDWDIDWKLPHWVFWGWASPFALFNS